MPALPVCNPFFTDRNCDAQPRRRSLRVRDPYPCGAAPGALVLRGPLGRNSSPPSRSGSVPSGGGVCGRAGMKEIRPPRKVPVAVPSGWTVGRAGSEAYIQPHSVARTGPPDRVCQAAGASPQTSCPGQPRPRPPGQSDVQAGVGPARRHGRGQRATPCRGDPRSGGGTGFLPVAALLGPLRAVVTGRCRALSSHLGRPRDGPGRDEQRVRGPCRHPSEHRSPRRRERLTSHVACLPSSSTRPGRAWSTRLDGGSSATCLSSSCSDSGRCLPSANRTFLASTRSPSTPNRAPESCCSACATLCAEGRAHERRHPRSTAHAGQYVRRASCVRAFHACWRLVGARTGPFTCVHGRPRHGEDPARGLVRTTMTRLRRGKPRRPHSSPQHGRRLAASCRSRRHSWS